MGCLALKSALCVCCGLCTVRATILPLLSLGTLAMWIWMILHCERLCTLEAVQQNQWMLPTRSQHHCPHRVKSSYPFIVRGPNWEPQSWRISGWVEDLYFAGLIGSAKASLWCVCETSAHKRGASMLLVFPLYPGKNEWRVKTTNKYLQRKQQVAQVFPTQGRWWAPDPSLGCPPFLTHQEVRSQASLGHGLLQMHPVLLGASRRWQLPDVWAAWSVCLGYAPQLMPRLMLAGELGRLVCFSQYHVYVSFGFRLQCWPACDPWSPIHLGWGGTYSRLLNFSCWGWG